MPGEPADCELLEERLRIELLDVNTPRPRHALVNIIFAPTMAGTPVVYDTACARTSFQDSS